MTIQLLSPAEVAKRLTAARGILVDVRTRGEFARLHASPAHSMPLDQLDPKTLESWKLQAGELYVICQGGKRSGMACEKLASAGVNNVYSVEGGTGQWEKSGLAVERGRGVISLERQVRIAAGSLVLAGTVLSLLVNIWFIGLAMFVGAGLVFAGITDFCGMGLLLAKMPWNRVVKSDFGAACAPASAS